MPSLNYKRYGSIGLQSPCKVPDSHKPGVIANCDLTFQAVSNFKLPFNVYKARCFLSQLEEN